MYIWRRAGWPHFRWNDRALLKPLADARLKQGVMLGAMARLGFDLQREATIEALAEEAVKTSEIEGEAIDRVAVRSSLARRLGVAAPATADRRADALAAMLIDATGTFAAPLTRANLFAWQASLFPTGRSGLTSIKVGAWRDDHLGPMQVVSGPIGQQTVHYEAPPASRVATEMRTFLSWFNRPAEIDGLFRAGLAHLWFVTIHPFEDGTGRIARAIADRALAQADGSRQRFYSMSSQIRAERADYYDELERAQSGNLDVTSWLIWFLGCFGRAIDSAEHVTGRVLAKAGFWQRHARDPLSARQVKVLNRMLDGFQGHLTAKKWAAMTKVSIPTAQRDINDLVVRGVLRRNPGGSKNTSYELVFDPGS